MSDSLDISHELLSRYGSQMSVEQHTALRQALLPLLNETRGGLRKRAINCLGVPLLIVLIVLILYFHVIGGYGFTALQEGC